MRAGQHVWIERKNESQKPDASKMDKYVSLKIRIPFNYKYYILFNFMFKEVGVYIRRCEGNNNEHEVRRYDKKRSKDRYMLNEIKRFR
jgi:hypothetical protein